MKNQIREAKHTKKGNPNESAIKFMSSISICAQKFAEGPPVIFVFALQFDDNELMNAIVNIIIQTRR